MGCSRESGSASLPITPLQKPTLKEQNRAHRKTAKSLHSPHPAEPPSPLETHTHTPYLINPRNIRRTRLTSHPAVAKALGIVKAPVPTMRLNMYTRPTCNQPHEPASECARNHPEHLAYTLI